MTDFFANLDYSVYALALMTGFFGSGHCAGMCGALVAGFFMKTEKKSVWPYLAYHFARITMYTIVGITAALLGVALVSTGLLGHIQGFLQVTIGFFVIILALGIVGLSPWQFSMKYMPTKILNKIFMSAARRGSVLGASMGGMLNGLMPCPLTFAMAVNATSAPGPIEGGLMMLALGIGTLPTMLVVTFAFGKLGTKARGLMLKFAAVLMIVMGANTMYNGIRFLASDNGFKEMMHHMQSIELMGIAKKPEQATGMEMDHSTHNMP
ncbi:sulfite exporter TauE/SafE family protein [Methyloprofundus sedimenti]|uniref:sulfite exporter TauE/SafE family protein n=1 Tax=Methyloprofundus sedimenti TaxID=1420851 RepID=UPI0018EA1B70|nr:sulfite exporter TauE/SafE family protein [Methyloprofundus sedimenti]